MRRKLADAVEHELLNDPMMRAIARATDPAAQLPDRPPSMSAAQIRAWAQEEADLHRSVWVDRCRAAVMNVRYGLVVYLVAASMIGAGLVVNLVTGRSQVQQQIEAQLAEYPGGEQINADEVAYGGFVIKFEDDGESPGTPDCPTGELCLYDRVGYGYPRVVIHTCGWLDLDVFGWRYRVESVHYNLPNGSATFYGIGQGSSPDGVALLEVNPNGRAIDDVHPYRNQAIGVALRC